MRRLRSVGGRRLREIEGHSPQQSARIDEVAVRSRRRHSPRNGVTTAGVCRAKVFAAVTAVVACVAIDVAIARPASATSILSTSVPVAHAGNAVAVNSVTHRVYVAVNDAGDRPSTVDVIDSRTDLVVDSISLPSSVDMCLPGVASEADFLAVDDATNSLFVASRSAGSNAVFVFDGATDRLTSQVTLDCPPSGGLPYNIGGLAVDQSTDTVYATYDAGLAVIHGFAFDSETTYGAGTTGVVNGYYGLTAGSGSVYTMQGCGVSVPPYFECVTRVGLPGQGPAESFPLDLEYLPFVAGMDYDPVNQTVYVANNLRNDVIAVDVSGVPADPVALYTFDHPNSVVVDSNTGTLYVTYENANAGAAVVTVITSDSVRNVNLSSVVDRIALDTSVRLAFATGNGAEAVFVLSDSSATAPDPPANVSAAGGPSSAVVSWRAPADNGNPISSYTVTASPGGATATVGGGVTTATVTGLTNGMAYTFTVAATNAIGSGLPSAPSNSVTPATIPDPPAGVLVTAGPESASVSFTPPANNGGSAVTHYTATCSSWTSSGTSSASGPGSPIVVSGLVAATGYTCTVTATNAVGDSPPSAAFNISTLPLPPAPTITKISRPSGPGGGGVKASIVGKNLKFATTVLFGDARAASFTVNVAGTRITAITPAEVAGTVDITVTTPGGTNAPSSTDQYTFMAPSVTKVTQPSGPSAGGRTVMITGKYLQGVTAVWFGNIQAASPTVNKGGTRIRVVAPAQATGTVDISVTTAGGTSPISAADQYQYI